MMAFNMGSINVSPPGRRSHTKRKDSLSILVDHVIYTKNHNQLPADKLIWLATCFKIFEYVAILRTVNFQIEISVSRFSLKIGRSRKICLHDIKQELIGGFQEPGHGLRRPPKSRSCHLLHAWGDLSEYYMYLKLRLLLHMVLLQTCNTLLCPTPNFIYWGWLVSNMFEEKAILLHMKNKCIV